MTSLWSGHHSSYPGERIRAGKHLANSFSKEPKFDIPFRGRRARLEDRTIVAFDGALDFRA